MLTSLRRKFVLITTALVGVVLAAVLGASIWGTYSQAKNQYRMALEMALSQEERQGPFFRVGPAPGGPEQRDDFLRVPTIVFDVKDGEIELDELFAYVSIDDDLLDEVEDEIEDSDATEGAIPEAHLYWMRTDTPYGWRVAITDTSTADAALRGQVIQNIGIFVCGIALIALISFFLARWALAPVEASWEQQKRFVADASHELKTPLSVIMANTQILSDHADKLPAEDLRWVEGTAEEASRMKALVDDLLDLARTDNELERIKESKGFTSINLSELVSRVALQFDAIAFEHECLIEETIDPGIEVQGSETALERLISILVDNACKYANPGSRIDVVLKREGSRARLSVTNQGNPIPEADLPHVFERFYRSDEARTKDGVGGYGLGLAIAKGIADAHKADLSVTSSATEGTCFSCAF